MQHSANVLDLIARRLPRRCETGQDGSIFHPPHAYVCAVHAKSGARITLVYEPTATGKVETRVYAVAEEPIVRRTNIH